MFKFLPCVPGMVEISRFVADRSQKARLNSDAGSSTASERETLILKDAIGALVADDGVEIDVALASQSVSPVDGLAALQFV